MTNIANSTRRDIASLKKSAAKSMNMKYTKVQITVQKKIVLKYIPSSANTSPSMGNVFTTTTVLTNILRMLMIK